MERAREDRGIVLPLVAMMMLTVLIVTAMVIDLGAKRSNRRSDQTIADLAALSAGYYLAGNGGATVVYNPFMACKAALNSAVTNVSSFAPSQDPTSSCSAFPANASIGCSAASSPVSVVFSDASHTLTIRYPIPASETTDARFTGGVGANDGINRCERMRVTFSQTQPTSFARVIGINAQATEATAVVRSMADGRVLNVATLVLFERSNCGALYAGGQGRLILEAPSSTNPAWVQADSEGKGTCTNNENENGRVIYAANSGNARIEVQPTVDGKEGMIGIYALNPAVNGRGGSVYGGPSASSGLSLVPVATEIASRRPVDDIYNPAGRATITSLHARAWNRVTTPPSGTYTSVSGAQCTDAGDITGTVVYVDCADFVAGAATRFPLATHVYFTGKVTVANNKSLSLPSVERLYVRGCRITGTPSGSTNCGNNPTSASSAYAVSVSGTLLVNSTSFAACPTYTPPGVGSLNHRTVEFATLGGPVIVGGGANVAMCQTTLYIGRSSDTYGGGLRRTTGGPNCTETKPCPVDSGTDWVDEGYMNVSGGNGLIHWSAPNRMVGPADAVNPLESLALWAESHRPSFLKGTGDSRSAGVFFMPNSAVTFQGQGDQSVPQNAQYFARTLTISGQGTLRMRPNPGDAVQIARPGSYAVIR